MSAGRLRAGGAARVLERALEKLEQHRGIVRGAVFLLDEAAADIGVEAAVGIPAEGLRGATSGRGRRRARRPERQRW